MMKKFLLLATRTLFFVLAVFVSIQAHANDYDFTRDGFYYLVTSAKEKTVEVTQCDPDMDIYVPSDVTYMGNTYTVTSIADEAFCWHNSSYINVGIPYTVTHIGNNVFEGCYYMNRIYVEEGNPTYDSRNNCNALIETATNTLIVGSNQTVIPEGVTSIGDRAFNSLFALTSITIPNSVTSIGDYAFASCNKLTSLTIGNGVTSIGDHAFEYCHDVTSLTIPNSVTSIGDYAFTHWEGLTSLIIGNNVTSIGASAFSSCIGLTSIAIPNSVTSIGDYAFSNCSGLTSIEVETGNPKYDSRNNCNALIETATNTLLCGSNSSIIPEDVTSIASGAFYNCSGLTSITIPNSVTSIGNSAFTGCSGLTSIEVEAGNTTYDSRNNCNALIETATNTLLCGSNSTIIPEGVTSIASAAFVRCSDLTSITIPNSVTSIGNSAFSGCGSLTSLTIGNSVTSIGSSAFRNCSRLTDVWCYAESVPSTQSDAFDKSSIGLATLHVPAASVESYRPSSPWSRFGTIVAIEGGEEPTVVIEVTDISQLNNAIYIEPFSARSGNTVSMSIRLKNNQDIAAYSFDLVLPEGVTLGKNAQNKFIYTLAENRHDEHSGTINEKDGNTYSVAVLSISGGEISGNDGTVITLQAVMDESMEEGEYPVQIQNARYSLPNGQMVEVASTQTALTIENVLVGDVNDNGTIDIGDAVCIVNYIVGKPNAVFVERAADVNDNGTVGEIGDAVSVVNIIVGKTLPQAARKVKENRINMLDPQ